MTAGDDVCVIDTNVLANITVFDEPLEAAKLLRSLIRQYQVRGKSIHDANVVAVMLTHGAYRLVTYNHADFERFNEIVLEPAPTEKISDAK
jgi:predicted nucleic acid-binding protein